MCVTCAGETNFYRSIFFRRGSMSEENAGMARIPGSMMTAPLFYRKARHSTLNFSHSYSAPLPCVFVCACVAPPLPPSLFLLPSLSLPPLPLHLSGSVAGKSIELFVDTGAQSSVISECMVRRLQLSCCVDRRVSISFSVCPPTLLEAHVSVPEHTLSAHVRDQPSCGYMLRFLSRHHTPSPHPTALSPSLPPTHCP